MAEYKTVHLRYDKYMEMKEKIDNIVHCKDCKHWFYFIESEKHHCTESDKHPFEEIVVDAEPIRHGHWEKVEETNGNYYHYACSKCGELPLNDNLVGEHTQLTPYCPWCGAKMDEVEE